MNEEDRIKINRKRVKEYLMSLFFGVIMLYGFWQVVVIVTADLSQIYKYSIAIAAAIALTVVALKNKELGTENQIKAMGSIIILILTGFWGGLVSFHPNLLWRIIIFSGGFGFTAYSFTLPLVWLARSIECRRGEASP